METGGTAEEVVIGMTIALMTVVKILGANPLGGCGLLSSVLSCSHGK